MNTNIDMRISGSGNIPSGEYNKVSVSGSGHLIGKVRCVSFSSSGSSKGEDIECTENFQVSGSSHFSGNIEAADVEVSGLLHCDGELIAKDSFSTSGNTKCGKSIKCEQLSVPGSLKVEGDIESESVKINGTVNCAGLLNAENIEIKFDRGMNIGSIGGSKIVIVSEKAIKVSQRLPLFLAKTETKRVNVNSSIEGDEVALEYVTCPRVTGRVIAIGQGCDIDLVQYSEDIEISPDAFVGETEKI
ncbi:MAG: polymer-forming cytoskeletal protein [Clostridia bacterium]|nr:polymer-forming cytoskeletal protein [Clostridia bacterium]